MQRFWRFARNAIFPLAIGTVMVVLLAQIHTPRTSAAADPCVDFNANVNELVEKQMQIAPSEVANGTFKVLSDKTRGDLHEILENQAKSGKPSASGQLSDQDKLGVLYRSAMDEDTINKRGYEPIKPYLAEIGAITDTASLVRYVEQTAGAGHSPVFGFDVEPDSQHTDVQIVGLTAGGLGLPTKNYYTDPKYAKNRDAYRALAERTLKLVGFPDEQAKAGAQQVLDIETKIADASLSPVEQRDPRATYQIVSLAEADATTPHLKWEEVFASGKIAAPQTVDMAPKKLFAAIDNLLASVPVDQWKAFLAFKLAYGSSGSLAQPFIDSAFEYAKTTTGQEEQKPRWQRAVSAVDSSMGDALGKLYVQQKVDPQTKPKVTELITNILAAVKARIENVTWMTPETKAKALEKWSKIGVRAAYPDKWRSWDALVVEDGKYYENLRAAQDFNRAYELSKLGKPTDKSEWITTPQVVNAFYEPTYNTINFPAAILQAPFFDPNASLATNYGAVGAVIGHETTHAFDDQGRQYDGDGNLTDWWTPQDEAQFKQRAQKLVDQYNAYRPFPDEPDLHVDGQLTLGENIADLGGLLAASDALQSLVAKGVQTTRPDERVSPQQLLFLSFATIWREVIKPQTAKILLASDPHSPNQFRVDGVVANVPAFGKAFGCKPGAPEYHTGNDLVSIW